MKKQALKITAWFFPLKKKVLPNNSILLDIFFAKLPSSALNSVALQFSLSVEGLERFSRRHWQKWEVGKILLLELMQP